MKNVTKRISYSALIVILVGLAAWWYAPGAAKSDNHTAGSSAIEHPVEGQMSAVEMKAGREEYFFNMLRDPATNRIPANIREREIEYSKNLPVRTGNQGGFKTKTAQATTTASAPTISWTSLGPKELGGRTRALGIDQRNSSIILAAGVSGGVWKSTDGGTTWTLKTNPNQNMSVTSLEQDPNNPDTWYYTSGEFRGNSAGARGFSARYFGTGIYKSTDNGESWSLIASTEDKDAKFSSEFDFISRIMVSPATGSVFAASNGFGLLRSTDGGTTFSLIMGGMNEHQWTDFDIDGNGNIIAVFSVENFGTAGSPGVFYSKDDGGSWTDITPSTFPTGHDRSVVTVAPSDSSIAYIFSEKKNSTTNQSVSFHRIDIDVNTPANSTSEDRSGNLPDYGDPVGGVNTQGGYNMLVSVKPDDPNFVLLGATNLFRSRDGFSTTPSGGYDNTDDAQKDEFWVGGYDNANDISQYPGQHPDQHVIAYDPSDVNKVWAGHDGGLSITTDITAVPVTWSNTDDGYVTGQFYTVEIPDAAGDNRIVGGTQDNGSPFFTFDNQNLQSSVSDDISSGDGSYAHIGPNVIYASSQLGRVLRWNSSFSTLDFVHPASAGNQLFIHPYVVDPNDEGIMYYPDGLTMWRHLTADEISNSSGTGSTDSGWDSFTVFSTSDPYTITTLEVSTASSSNVLYIGASSNSQSPKIFRLDNSTSSQNPVDISISAAPAGAYVHDIAINPNNSDEAIVVLSNYNITGIYHTADGGTNWTAVEGNLEGTENTNPGPSIRNATIFPENTGTIYLVGTSTGIYSTSSLAGGSTTWSRESDDGSAGSIGFSVVEFVTSRISDGKIAVGSHGRGIFMGQVESSGQDPNDTTPPADPTGLEANTSNSDIQLTWTANTEADLGKYRIYRGNDVNALSLYDSTGSAAISYLDANTNFENYFYRITAVDVNGNESGFSNPAAVRRAHVVVDTNWKLAGSPLTSASAASVPSSAELVTFDGGYQVTNSFDPQKGYWVKSTATDSIEFDGGAFTELTLALNAGWNLIPGIADTIAVGNIQDPNGILSTSPVFEYDGATYVEAADLKPGVGYWINANLAGDIVLKMTTTSAKSAPLVEAVSPENRDLIVFSRGGVERPLYVTGKNLSRDQKMQYLLPPLAPATILDVRTSSGFKIVDSKTEELLIEAETYPVRVKLKKSNTGNSYRIKGISEGEEIYYDLQPGQSKLITKEFEKIYLEKLSGNEVPLTFDLLPNYPNPFNPTTNITYKVASESFVSLAVYDVLGRQVRILTNKVQQPGVYTQTFNATDLSSGTYFIRIKAGDFNRVQQMTLIK